MRVAVLRSLRLRLLLFAVAGTGIAITVAAVGLLALFDRYLEHRVVQELDAHVVQLAALLRLDAGERVVLTAEPGDPRFQRPLGGLYWQVQDQSDGRALRSRSLWDGSLEASPEPMEPGTARTRHTLTPDGRPAVQRDRVLLLSRGGREHPVQLSVAIDRTALAELRSGFFRDLLPGLVLLGALILGGAWVQVGAGLAPLRTVGRGLARVRDGSAPRLEATVPTEIEPLVAELNALLAAQDGAMQRARDRAADLAHGLKTPLTALAGDVARLRAAGQDAVAADIEALGAQMQRTIARELARARLRYRGSPVVPVPLAPTAEAIIRTLRRTPRGETLRFESTVPAGHALPILVEDLADILGNLAENAARTARTTVRLGSSLADGHLVLDVEDDGAGARPDAMERLAARGRRQDEGGSGAGLGLAIVSDIVEAYGGSIGFDASPLGGLRVRCALPLRPPGGAGARS